MLTRIYAPDSRSLTVFPSIILNVTGSLAVGFSYPGLISLDDEQYKVIWADIAEDDLKKIIEFIANESIVNAQRVFDKIKDRVSILFILPDQGRLVPELKDQGILQYRELIQSPWRIIYRISENKVYVLAVLDSRRNIEDILLKRLVNQDI